MGYAEFDLGRDPDEMAMAIDRRSISQRLRILLEKILKLKNNDPTAIEEGFKEELPEQI